jgi:hypothetical protein
VQTNRTTILVLFLILVTVSFARTASAQTITFTFVLSCNPYIDPSCPQGNILVATQVGQVASDVVAIATVNSDVPGYTSPVPVNGGSLNWVSTPATYAQCASGIDIDCGARYDNPGGNSTIAGSVFGLPSGSSLLIGSFQAGATSEYATNLFAEFAGGIDVSLINPAILANLGLAGYATSGTGNLNDTFYPPTPEEDFSVSVTFTPTPTPVVRLSPIMLNFGPQGLDAPNTPQTVTLTNIGALPLLVTTVGTTGPNGGDFSEQNNCPMNPSTLPPGDYCSITVFFSPIAVGIRNANLTITDNAPDSPQMVSLTGIGVGGRVGLK